MKRFYKEVMIEAEGGGWSLRLDGRGVKTPARQPLRLATRALAEAVAEEWQGQGETILPASMPLTQLANAACDLSDEDRARIVEHLAGYAATELLCYREPRGALRRAQEAEWEPWLVWAERRYGTAFVRVEGIMPVAQPEATLLRLREVTATRGAEGFVALNALAGGLGSLLLAMAVSEAALGAEAAFGLSRLEAAHQESRWGEDAEAQHAAASLRQEMLAAERFIRLCEA